MTRKIGKEKYERILKRLSRGESQKSIVIAEKCSYGTISAAKHWNKTWKSTTISTSNTTENISKIVVSIPNFWLDRLNEDIVAGIWKDYSDAVLDIIRTYFRSRYDDFQSEPGKTNLRKRVLNEFKEAFQSPNRNLHKPRGDDSLLKLRKESNKEFEKEKSFVRNLLKEQKSDESIFKNYHGTPIIKEEYDVLIELEDQIGKIPRWEYKTPQLQKEDSIDLTNTAFPLREKKVLIKFSYVILGNHIIGLILQNKGLTFLPKTIHQLKYLQLLDLRNNKLTELPETIGELEYLDELVLENNALTSIPESFNNLKNLEILQLDNNDITTVPKFFGNLRCDLFLANNKITTVDKTILNKNNVDLTGNPIGEI